MRSALAWAKSKSATVAISVATHGVLLGLIVWLGIHVKVNQRPSSLADAAALLERAGGTHAVRLILPKMADVGTVPKVAPEDEREKSVAPARMKPKKAMGGQPMIAHDGNGTGDAATGNGSDAENITPSFPVYSPRPAVTDRSLLPATERKIVVDVNVDEVGAVVREVLVKGLGNKLDQIVLETVKGWRFQPATKEGKAVPTEAELIFPFGPATPISAG